jgi:hypothetical protein
MAKQQIERLRLQTWSKQDGPSSCAGKKIVIDKSSRIVFDG